jgi:hypothetical protein
LSYLGRIQRAIVEGYNGRAPYWITSKFGGVFLQALGVTLDNAQASLLHGLKQTRPLVALESSLAYLEADRGVRRYPTIPLAAHRERLKKWRQIRHYAGTHYGQMISLQPYFLPVVPRIRIVHQMGDGSCATWHTLDAEGVYTRQKITPSNWDWDGIPEWWSRFWVIIDVSGMTYNGATWDDGTEWDDGVTVWDGYLSEAQRDDIVAIINDSKAAHSVLWGVILASDPDSFDPTSTAVTDPDGWTSLPTGNWGYAIDATTGLPSRLPTALFAYDIGGELA